MAVDLNQFANKKPKVDLSKFSKEKEGFGSRFKTQFKKGLGELIQPSIGAVKGLGSTIAGASELGQRGLAALTPGGQIVERPDGLKRALTPTNTGQKIGFAAEQIAEFAVPGSVGLKAGKGAKLGAKVLEGALSTGGVSALQSGKIGKEALTGAVIGGAAPALFKTAGVLTGGTKRLIRKATGLTGNEAKNLNIIAKTKDPNTGKSIYKGVEDFLVKKGILGRGKEVLNRGDMVNRAESLLETTFNEKRSLIKNIPGKADNTFSKLLGLLNKKVTTLNKTNAGALDDEMKFLKGIIKKKKLTASDIDKARSIADDLIYSETDKLVQKNIRKLITPLRSALDKLDKSKTLKTVNTDIRLLKQLTGSKGSLTKAAERGVEGRVSLTGGAALASSAIPGLGQIASPILGMEAITSIPQIAAPLARGAIRIGESSITPSVSAMARGATNRLINSKQSRQ